MKHSEQFNSATERKSVVWHIPHAHSKEMSKKSVTVSQYMYMYVINCSLTY